MSSENSPREPAREGALNLQWYHVNDVCGDIFVACGLFYFSFERKITMDKKILKLLEKNARIEVKDIAAITGKSEAKVASEMKAMQDEGIIRGYKGVIDWERVETDAVSAIIELKVVPTAGLGFEEVAARIAKYPEVESVYLMSGACDLMVTVKGKTFREVSDFLSKELARIDSVTSTATQFIMRRYKESGVELTSNDEDERGNFSL